VPWPQGPTTQASLQQLADAFEDAHERTYGHRARESMVELVNLHLVARGVPDAPRVPATLRFAEEHAVPAGERRAYFGKEYGWLAAAIYLRGGIGSDARQGPIIIQEFDATILVPPDFFVKVDAYANVVMTRQV
jgi:N-methylhydantoinase A